METFDITELKDYLAEMHKELSTLVESDPEYDGEVDELMKAITRLQGDLASVKTQEAFTDEVKQQIMPDLAFVMGFLNEFIEMDEDSEFGDDDDDFDDEDSEFDEDDEFDIEIIEDEDEETSSR
jgi:hypothetical protein